MIPDYHIHTSLCKHAQGTMEAYVETAITKGFSEIAFTDHIPLPNQFDRAHRMAETELDGYIKKIGQLQTRYPEIIIKKGIEADFYDGFEDYLQQTFLRFDFDLVIMSVHFIRGWPEGSWVFKYNLPGRSLTEIYSDYLQAVIRGIKTGLFDIIGHVDLIKSPEQSLLKENQPELENLFHLAAGRNMAVEINTSGLRKAINEPYPNINLLPLIQKAGLPFTLGSDAHNPHQVGCCFTEISPFLQMQSGLQPALFKKRKLVIKTFNP